MRASRILLGAALAANLSLAVRAELINGIKAVVHDAIVTKHEVERSTAQAEEVLRRQYRNQPEVYEKKLLEALNENLEERMKRQLILHDFKTGGYKIPEAIINEAVDEEIRARWGDRKELVKSLQALGRSYERFRQERREDIIMRALYSKNVRQEIVVSPHRIERFYLANKDKFQVEEQVKLRMIVLNKTSEAEAAGVRRLAAEIRDKIKGGVAFSEMAAIHSANRNAESTWWSRTALLKELADVAFNLKVGEMSEPLDLEKGVFLLLVEDKRPAHTKALSEVRAQVEEILQQEERARIEKQWIDRLRKKTFIRYF